MLQTVAHLSTNQVQCRMPTLIESIIVPFLNFEANWQVVLSLHKSWIILVIL